MSEGRDTEADEAANGHEGGGGASDESRQPAGGEEEVVPPTPKPIAPERMKELEEILDAQFADGEDVEEGDDDDFNLFYPR